MKKSAFIHGFTIAEFLLTMLVTLCIAAAVVPLVGPKKIKIPFAEVHHGMAQCYYDNYTDPENPKLMYYYVDNRDNENAVAVPIEGGTFCQFTPPAGIKTFEIITVAPGGRGFNDISGLGNFDFSNDNNIKGTLNFEGDYLNRLNAKKNNGDSDVDYQLTPNEANIVKKAILRAVKDWPTNHGGNKLSAKFRVTSASGRGGYGLSRAYLNSTATNCNNRTEGGTAFQGVTFDYTNRSLYTGEDGEYLWDKTTGELKGDWATKNNISDIRSALSIDSSKDDWCNGYVHGRGQNSGRTITAEAAFPLNYSSNESDDEVLPDIKYRNKFELKISNSQVDNVIVLVSQPYSLFYNVRRLQLTPSENGKDASCLDSGPTVECTSYHTDANKFAANNAEVYEGPHEDLTIDVAPTKTTVNTGCFSRGGLHGRENSAPYLINSAHIPQFVCKDASGNTLSYSQYGKIEHMNSLRWELESHNLTFGGYDGTQGYYGTSGRPGEVAIAKIPLSSDTTYILLPAVAPSGNADEVRSFIATSAEPSDADIVLSSRYVPGEYDGFSTYPEGLITFSDLSGRAFNTFYENTFVNIMRFLTYVHKVTSSSFRGGLRQLYVNNKDSGWHWPGYSSSGAYPVLTNEYVQNQFADVPRNRQLRLFEVGEAGNAVSTDVDLTTNVLENGALLDGLTDEENLPENICGSLSKVTRDDGLIFCVEPDGAGDASTKYGVVIIKW